MVLHASWIKDAASFSSQITRLIAHQWLSLQTPAGVASESFGTLTYFCDASLPRAIPEAIP